MASPLERGRALLRELEVQADLRPRSLNPMEQSWLAAVIVQQVRDCLVDPEQMTELLNTIGIIVNKTAAAMAVRDLVQQYVARTEKEPVRKYWDGVKRELFPV